MALTNIFDTLASAQTTRREFEQTWQAMYPQLLAACQQALANRDADAVASCDQRLRTIAVHPGISSSQREWIQACLSAWLCCTHTALLVADISGRDVAALVQYAREAVQATQRLYRPLAGSSGPPSRNVVQRLNHWPSLSVVSVFTVLASEGVPVSYARDVTQHLLGRGQAPMSSLQVTVLLSDAQTGNGVAGRLVLETLAGGQGDLFPHPCQMGSVLHETFMKAIGCAQSYIQSQGHWPQDIDVRWWVARWHSYTPLSTFELTGDSLGGAFAVGLECLFQQRPVDTLCAITAAVTPSGDLHGVGELPAKLRAAAEAGITQVIVARDQDCTGVDPQRWLTSPAAGVVVLRRQ